MSRWVVTMTSSGFYYTLQPHLEGVLCETCVSYVTGVKGLIRLQ